MTAQWDDDVHHAVHALVTGERHGYYVDFGTPEVLRKALTSVFVHDGGYSTFRGKPWGREVPPGDRRPPVRRRRLHARPGGQPRARRPPVGAAGPRPARRRGRPDPAVPVHADALHGRGVGHPDAVAVLHRPPGARPGDGRPRRPAPRVRRPRLGGPLRRRRRGARPAGTRRRSRRSVLDARGARRCPTTPACATGTGP